MFESTGLVTAEELARLPDDGYRYELVEGRLVRMSPVTFEHGRVVLRMGFLLSRHLEQHPSGVVGTEIGFKLASNPDTVRGPDIAFVKSDRVPTSGGHGYFTGAPDLVIEVLSPEDRPGETRQKMDGYIERGVSLAVVIDPRNKTATTFQPGAPSVNLRSEDDVLDLGAVIPGFRCQLRDIFQ